MDATAGDTPNGESQPPLAQAPATTHVPMTEEQIRAIHIGVLMPLVQPILIAEYDLEWPRLFEREAARVQAALGNRILLLEHIGSTSVARLAAKPKIDMLLVVANSADEPAYVPDLEAAGYLLRVREPDWYEHRLFKGAGHGYQPARLLVGLPADRARAAFPQLIARQCCRSKLWAQRRTHKR